MGWVGVVPKGASTRFSAWPRADSRHPRSVPPDTQSHTDSNHRIITQDK